MIYHPQNTCGRTSMQSLLSVVCERRVKDSSTSRGR